MTLRTLSSSVVFFCCCVMLHAQDPMIAQPGDGPAEAAHGLSNAAARREFFHNRLTYPGGVIPRGARARAWEYAQNTMRLFTPKSSGSTLQAAQTWRNIGPFNIGGRIPAIAVNPKNPNTIFIGAADGGVWRTRDEGKNWTSVSDEFPTQSMGALAIDPVDTNIVYAGTGEANFGINQFDGAGLFKSSDGGNTWRRVGAGTLPDYARVSDLIVDPKNTSTLYAAIPDGVRADTLNGLYKSTDGGETWRLVFPGMMTDVVLDPQNPSTLYTVSSGVSAGVPVPRPGMFKSIDGGATWTQLDVGVPPESMGRTSIAISASDPRVLFIGVSELSGANTRTWLLGVFKSTDAGATWTKCPVPYDYLVAQGWFDNIVGIHPTNPDIVYAGGVSLIRTSDGGATWTRIPDWYTGAVLHVDQHAIEYNPLDPDRVYIGNDGGFFVLTNNGATVEKRDRGLSITQFVGGAMHPSNDAYRIGGTQDNSTQIGSEGSDWAIVLRGDGGNSAVDPQRPNIVYGMQQNLSFWRSEDFGRTWAQAMNGINNDGSLFYISYDMDPAEPATLYLGTYRLYKTTNGGRLWTMPSSCLFPSPSGGCYYISAVSVSTADPRYVFAGSNSGAVAISSNGGGAWTVTSTGLPAAYVSAVRSFEPDVVYATFSRYGVDKVWRSSDYGATWNSINGNLPDVPVNDILRIDGKLVIGTEVGAFVSDDEGTTWQRLGTGLPAVAVFRLRYSANTGTLRAITHGRGMYDLQWKILPDAAPVFVSRPDTTMLEIGQPFLYAPVVTGAPTPRLSMVEGPAGAEFDPLFGQLRWSGGARVARFTLEATNSAGSTRQVFHLVSNDAPLTDWRIASTDRFPTRVQRLRAVDARTLWVARDSAGVSRSTDGAATWTHMRLPGTWANVMTIFPLDRDRAFAGTNGGQLYKTVDGGASWTLSLSGINASFGNIHFWNENEGITITQGERDSAEVYFTQDGGTSWRRETGPRSYARSPLSSTLTFFDRAMGCYASGNTAERPPKDASILRTTDGGRSWLTSSAGTRSAAGIGFLSSTKGYLVDPIQGRARRTVSGGAAWNSTFWPMNGQRLMAVHANPAAYRLWVVTDSAAWWSVNEGNAWTRTSLAYIGSMQSADFVDSTCGWAISAEGIVQTIDLRTLDASQPPHPARASLIIGQSYPHPAMDAVTLPVTTGARGRLLAVAQNLAGREVAVLHDGDLPAGQHLLSWDTHTLSPGTYFVTIRFGTELAVQRVVVAR